MPQAVRPESLPDTSLTGTPLERLHVAAIYRQLAVNHEKIAIRQMPGHFPQIRGNRDIPVFPCLTVLQRHRLPAVPGRLLRDSKDLAAVPETRFLHRECFPDTQA